MNVDQIILDVVNSIYTYIILLIAVVASYFWSRK